MVFQKRARTVVEATGASVRESVGRGGVRLSLVGMVLAVGLGVLASVPVRGAEAAGQGRRETGEAFVEVSPVVYRFADTCNVYVIKRGRTGVAIDCGSGKWLDFLGELGIDRVAWVLFTHHHRDQCQGAQRVLASGAKVAVPAEEQRFFGEVEDYWRTVKIYRRYEFKPDFFVLRQSLSRIDKTVADGEALEVEGLRMEAVATPGHTPGSMSYVVEVAGKKVAFVGDLIHSPGKLWNAYSLQYAYADCGYQGANETLDSLGRLMAAGVETALPSHGVVITDLAAARITLGEHVRALVWYFTSLKPKAGPWFSEQVRDSSMETPDWLRVHGGRSCYSYTLVDEAGHGFMIDPAMEESWEGVVSDERIKTVERIWITHYHDDHVLMTNKVRERYGAEVWAHEKLVDVLEQPRAYNLPCLMEEPIKVDRVVREGESFSWRGWDCKAYNWPTQTYWHAGLLMQRDGVKYFVSGDGLYHPQHGADDNCRNYLRLEEDDGMVYSGKLLRELRPDYVLGGHGRRWRTYEEDFDYLLMHARQLRPVVEALVGQEDANFGMDEQWAHCYPYRSVVRGGATVGLAVRVRNHLGRAAEAEVEIRYPTDWQVGTVRSATTIAGKKTGQCLFELSVPEAVQAGRYVVTANVVFAGRDWGEVAEAIIDVN